MATNQDASPPVADSTLQLDIAKLHGLPSEQQDLYLLTFTSDLSRYATSLDEDGASANQVWIKKELLQIVDLTSPAPTRVIRNNLASTFASLFTKGNRKLLYESINDLVAVLNAGKDKPLKAKHAAVHCLGAIFEAAGDSAISLSGLTCTSLLRTLKIASTHAGLRSAVYKALGRVARGIGNSIDESVAKETWKSARAAASSDKACWFRSMPVGVSNSWPLAPLIMTTQTTLRNSRLPCGKQWIALPFLCVTLPPLVWLLSL